MFFFFHGCKARESIACEVCSGCQANSWYGSISSLHLYYLSLHVFRYHVQFVYNEFKLRSTKVSASSGHRRQRLTPDGSWVGILQSALRFLMLNLVASPLYHGERQTKQIISEYTSTCPYFTRKVEYDLGTHHPSRPGLTGAKATLKRTTSRMSLLWQ